MLEFIKLKVRNKNKVLGVSQGSTSTKTGLIILYDDVECHDQMIYIQYNEDQSISLFFRHSGYCLAVPQGSRSRGTNLCQYPYQHLRDQKWTLIKKSSEYFKLQNVNSGHYLAVSQNKSSNGTKFCQWTDTNEDGQFFSMEGKFFGSFDR